MAAKRNPDKIRIAELEEQVEKALLSERYMAGYKAKSEDELSKVKSERDDRFATVERAQSTLQDQMAWMRQLVEIICVPAEKMEQLEKARLKIMNDSNYVGDMPLRMKRGY